MNKYGWSINHYRGLISCDRKAYMEKHGVEDNNDMYHAYLNSLYDLMAQEYVNVDDWLKVLSQIFFVDAYKIVNYKVNEKGDATLEERELYFRLESMLKDTLNSNLTVFRANIDKNRKVLNDMSDLSFIYMNLPEAEKHKLMRSISEEKHNELNYILPFHCGEAIKYNKELKTEDYKKLYTDLIKKGFTARDASAKISELLLVIEEKDNKSYLGAFRDIAQTYYKWTRFLSDQSAELVSKNDRVIIKALEEIEVDEFATYMSYNKVLSNIVMGYMNYAKGQYKVNHDGVSILFDERVVDNHLYNKVDNRILNRLKIEKPVEKKKNS